MSNGGTSGGGRWEPALGQRAGRARLGGRRRPARSPTCRSSTKTSLSHDRLPAAGRRTSAALRGRRSSARSRASPASTSAQVQIVLSEDTALPGPGLAGDRVGAPDAPTRPRPEQPCSGIAHMVASSVQGPRPSNVTITDQTGAHAVAGRRRRRRRHARRKLEAGGSRPTTRSSPPGRRAARRRRSAPARPRRGQRRPERRPDHAGLGDVRRQARSPLSQTQTSTRTLQTSNGSDVRRRGRHVRQPAPRVHRRQRGRAAPRPVPEHHRARAERRRQDRQPHRRSPRARSTRCTSRCWSTSRPRRPKGRGATSDRRRRWSASRPSRGDTMLVASVPFAKQTASTGAAGGPLGMIGVPARWLLVRDALIGLAALVFLFLLRRNLRAVRATPGSPSRSGCARSRRRRRSPRLEAADHADRDRPASRADADGGRGDRPAPARAGRHSRSRSG